MKVSIKTLKGSSFEVEVEPTSKVRHPVPTPLIRANLLVSAPVLAPAVAWSGSGLRWPRARVFWCRSRLAASGGTLGLRDFA
jgi:hypothetical protein